MHSNSTSISADDQLVHRCRAGDEAAWHQLIESYGRLVMAIALGSGLAHEDAADVSQVTFLALLQQVDSLGSGTRLGPWLATVARRQSWRLLRQRNNNRASSDDELALIAIDDPALGSWEQGQWLEQALDCLDDRCRELLSLLYLESPPLSYTEAASRLDMPIGSIGPTRGRCLERLRAQLMEQSAGAG